MRRSSSPPDRCSRRPSRDRPTRRSSTRERGTIMTSTTAPSQPQRRGHRLLVRDPGRRPRAARAGEVPVPRDHRVAVGHAQRHDHPRLPRRRRRTRAPAPVRHRGGPPRRPGRRGPRTYAGRAPAASPGRLPHERPGQHRGRSRHRPRRRDRARRGRHRPARDLRAGRHRPQRLLRHQGPVRGRRRRRCEPSSSAWSSRRSAARPSTTSSPTAFPSTSRRQGDPAPDLHDLVTPPPRFGRLSRPGSSVPKPHTTQETTVYSNPYLLQQIARQRLAHTRAFTRRGRRPSRATT